MKTAINDHTEYINPEVKLLQVNLLEAGKVAPNGNVEEWADHPVNFPVPVLAHFIGVSTQ